MKKVIVSLAVATVFAMSFVACQPKTETEEPAQDTVAVEQPVVEEPVAETPAEPVAEETPAQ
ncbi:MAG TPA: hypothetical protein P5228_08215 [Bacteroidales bacterium]|nr:hypothetical protein [Bacteroidales bacterium]HRZ49838.1 hypothetical protein [Bacteroidales bacterium]